MPYQEHGDDSVWGVERIQQHKLNPTWRVNEDTKSAQGGDHHKQTGYKKVDEQHEYQPRGVVGHTAHSEDRESNPQPILLLSKKLTKEYQKADQGR